METLEQDIIVNKVANSALVSIDLEDWYPHGKRSLIDIKDQLFQGLILREKDFRGYIKNTDWSIYKDHYVAITCTEDAIVPTWAYMLLTIALQPYAKKIVFGTLDALEQSVWQEMLQKIDVNSYQNAKVVIKGCSKMPVPVYAYTELTRLLTPIAASIMYGEPCSTVPLYKKQPTV